MDAIIIRDEEIEEREEKIECVSQEEYNSILLYIISCLFCFFVGVRFLQTSMEVVPQYLTARLMEAISIIFCVFYCKFGTFKLHRTGFIATKSEIKRTLVRSGFICLLVMVLLVLSKLILSKFNSEIAAHPWFEAHLDIDMRWLYPLVVVVQEFCSKCIMQDNIKRLCGEKNILITLLVCSMIFGILHICYPMYYMLCAGLLSFVTGYIYEKDKSIWGCILVHFFIGFFPMAIGVQSCAGLM